MDSIVFKNLNSLDANILALQEEHPEVQRLILEEIWRQNDTVELIASENFPSQAVRAACASVFMDKYSEGYAPDRNDGLGSKGRYYGGCGVVNKLEEACCDAWRKVFDTHYHVNVQPHSGSHANMAAYLSVLNLGDKILSMDMSAGHLTHSSPASFVSKFFEVHTYGVNEEGLIDMDEVERIAMEVQPKLIIAGASAYSRIIDFQRFCNIAKKVGAYFMVDMAHIAGLVAAGDHPSPFGLADIVTSTTQKTLRGPRGGLIFCSPDLAKKVDSAVFPLTSGGPAQNIIAAKLVAAEEDATPAFHRYIHQVVKNTKHMADIFSRNGFDVVTGGTDNHLFLIDFSRSHPHLTGKAVQEGLEKYGITLNKNMVPGDKRKPGETSGVRIGLAAMTTKGWKELDCSFCAYKMMDLINNRLK